MWTPLLWMAAGAAFGWWTLPPVDCSALAAEDYQGHGRVAAVRYFSEFNPDAGRPSEVLVELAHPIDGDRYLQVVLDQDCSLDRGQRVAIFGLVCSEVVTPDRLDCPQWGSGKAGLNALLDELGVRGWWDWW
jgi:hypothetical protein